MYVTPSGSRIAHWWCTKEAPDHVLALLGAPKVAAQVPHHLPLGAGPPATRGVGLDILIQELPRVQFRAVGRQVDQPNLCLVALHPRPHFSGDMHWMAVHNQINLPTPVPNQATQKVDEHLPIEVLLEHPEPEDTLVGQGGDDVAPEALTSTRDHRCLSLWAPGAPRLMVPAYSHLITPVNLRPFRFGLFSDVRISLFQPAPHRRRVLFLGPAGRFLGSQAPAPQRPPHPPYRESQAKALFNQDAHRLAGPQGRRQAQLVRGMSLDQRHYGRLLSSWELGRRWATLGLWPSAVSPPWRYWPIHRATVPRATPKVRAAVLCFIPIKMACTARLRKASWASGEMERASFTCTTQHLFRTFWANYGQTRQICHLFTARSNNYLIGSKQRAEQVPTIRRILCKFRYLYIGGKSIRCFRLQRWLRVIRRWLR